MNRIFLLSPADCTGARARQLLAPGARSPLAVGLHSAEGAELGDVFSFVSGLYFRGKLTYARRFARLGDDAPTVAGGGVLVITAGAGLREAATRITADAFRRFAGTPIDPMHADYRDPLVSGARALEQALPGDATFVLLGSIASPKYVDALLGVFGDRLLFPLAFVGRGDMSRGGLLLRSVASGQELEYGRVAGSVRHGPRPPKLPPLD